MNRQINGQEKLNLLMDEYEMQLFNTTMSGSHSFVEVPEAWELNDFDDVISNMEMN